MVYANRGANSVAHGLAKSFVSFDNFVCWFQPPLGIREAMVYDCFVVY